MTLSRRRILKNGALAIAATSAGMTELMAMLATAAAAERGPPVPDHPLQRLSPHVHMVWSPDGFPTPQNQGMMSNIVFVVGSAGVMVIDSGASVQIAEMTVRQLRRLTDKPVVGIVNTHYHGDHWLGNQAFRAAYGADLPIYALAPTRMAIEGAVGRFWHEAMNRWTNDATVGTDIVPPNRDIAHGDTLSLGDVTLRLHHYGRAHTDADVAVEVVEDGVMCVGDILMDRRIANMEDGSYQGTFEAIDKLIAASRTTIWVPAHGEAGTAVLTWQRELFAGIWESCVEAVKQGIPLEGALAFTLKDPRVASRAAETKGWANNIGKYVSLAYLEAEQAQF